MVIFQVIYSKQAQKDAKMLTASSLQINAASLIEILQRDPFHTPPPYEKLIGDLAGFYSRRINIKHRLVYQVIEDQKIVKVLRMWSHYE